MTAQEMPVQNLSYDPGARWSFSADFLLFLTRKGMPEVMCVFKKTEFSCRVC